MTAVVLRLAKNAKALVSEVPQQSNDSWADAILSKGSQESLAIDRVKRFGQEAKKRWYQGQESRWASCIASFVSINIASWN
jgi:hypothetical protein